LKSVIFIRRRLEMKSVRFLCDDKLLDEVDAHRSRYICRTEIIEAALRQYLKVVASNGGRLVGMKGWSV
jgi:metal-responsive CopG/Arc/MetJ family transcriptional regulator